MNITADRVRASLGSVIEPEMGVNVVDLGLIVDLIIEDGKVSVDMTLPNPGSPVVGEIAAAAEQAVRTMIEREEGDGEEIDVEVSLVWDPPWTIDRVTAAGREQLDRGG